MAKNALANGLGWFSVALGAAQITTPQGVAEAIGVEDHEALMRFIGAREISAGIGILSQPFPVGWIWGRVAGDAMDITLLSLALANENNDRARVGAALGAVAGITALDMYCATEMSRQPRVPREKRGESAEGRIVKTISIERSPEELYAYWRDFNNLPRFMQFLQSVQTVGERRARWSFKGPGNMRMDLDAEITEDSPGRGLAWRASLRGRFETTGRVRFMPGLEGHGSVVRLEMQMRPALFGRMPKIFGEVPGEIAAQNLRRFKQLMETGEILSNVGQPSGRPEVDRLMRKAQYGEIPVKTEPQPAQARRIPLTIGGKRDGRES